MADIAYALDLLVPNGDWQGSVTAGNEAAFNAIRWNDSRPKPTWAAVQAAGNPGPDKITQLKTLFTALPVAQQAAFGPVAASVLMFLENGNQAAAVKTVEDVTVPAELEAVKTALLGALNG